ncbi:MAG: methyltransferase [Deltaproteobacteria bacterium]|nr:methyltransferase [Deltaproteobacteria bacterium]
MTRQSAWIGFALLVLMLAFGVGVVADSSAQLARWTTGAHRGPGNADRNAYRHPGETLEFFGLEPTMTVVEIWPSRGWYTEILAPFLRADGKYYAAGFALTAKRTPGWRKKMQRELEKKLAARPDLYDRVVVTELSIPERAEIAPPGTANMVLTFRNVHNWMKGGYAPQMFEAMFAALEPGGVLGVVEHRAKPGTSVEKMIESGYVTEAQVKKLAKRAGFRFVASSEVNANPKDTADHPMGVWTLPPTLRLGDKDRQKYVAIGESDRMTLKFIKPKKRRDRK